MKVKRFEDLIAWQKARTLTSDIYGITQSGDFSRDFGLRDQIRRASVSIMSNIAEGFERNSPADFARFFTMAKASCAEVPSQLYIAQDVGYLSENDFSNLMDSATEVSRIIGGLKVAVQRQK